MPKKAVSVLRRLGRRHCLKVESGSCIEFVCELMTGAT